jgi:hypothetical protein
MLKILKHLYFAKTIDMGIFDDGINKKGVVNLSDPVDTSQSESNLQREFLSHRIIKLYIFCKCCRCWSKYEKL